jgi:hypothetical protein
VADATDWRTGQAFFELGFAPGEQFDQSRLIEPVTRREISFPREWRKAVPWAGQLAIVAAVDSIAQQRPQRLRDGVLGLDRQVGNA